MPGERSYWIYDPYLDPYCDPCHDLVYGSNSSTIEGSFPSKLDSVLAHEQVMAEHKKTFWNKEKKNVKHSLIFKNIFSTHDD